MKRLADALGKWKLEGEGLAPGAYNLTLVQTTPEGQETALPGPVTVTVGGDKRPLPRRRRRWARQR